MCCRSCEMNEADYRRKVQQTMDRIERSFSDVDPDVAECEQALGSLVIISSGTITSSQPSGDRSRLILSTQPSVRQIWLALAAKGIAHHFNYVPEKDQWMDDKGKNIELLDFLRTWIIRNQPDCAQPLTNALSRTCGNRWVVRSFGSRLHQDLAYRRTLPRRDAF